MPTAVRTRRRREGGFTIIEVAMASFIMAFGLATSIIVMQSGYMQVDLARGTTLASQIIQSEMERLRLLSWTGISTLRTTTDNVLPTSNGTTGGNPQGVEVFDGATNFGTSGDIAGKFTVTRTVAVDATRSDIMNITISVRWQTYDLRWHTRSFTAIYAQNGLYDYYYTIAHP
jgi:Tfp pilus assembly protein PilV